MAYLSGARARRKFALYAAKTCRRALACGVRGRICNSGWKHRRMTAGRISRNRSSTTTLSSRRRIRGAKPFAVVNQLVDHRSRASFTAFAASDRHRSHAVGRCHEEGSPRRSSLPSLSPRRFSPRRTAPRRVGGQIAAFEASDKRIPRPSTRCFSSVRRRFGQPGQPGEGLPRP